MSDVSQGPGWWQASDGKWYPPESRPGAAAPPAPQPTAPAPEQKKRHGCLLGGLAGVGGIVVLLGLIIVIVIVVAVANSGSDKKPSTSVPVGQGTNEHPAINDVSVSECTPGSSSALNFPAAKGQITNHSSKASNYSFTVSFESNGQRVASGTVFENDVAPGQSAAWETDGTPASQASPIQCTVTQVNRFAS